MVLALRHQVLPQTLHVDAPSPHVDWSAGGVRLLTEPVAWERGSRPRRAGISSFGISGTNAHLILEEPPPVPEPQASQPPPQQLPLPWLISAKTPTALEAQIQQLRTHLHRQAPGELGDAGLSGPVGAASRLRG